MTATAEPTACSMPGVDVASCSADFVDFGDEAAVRAALAQPTALLWIETPSNPLLRITDIARFAQAGHAAGALVAVAQYLPLAVVAEAHQPGRGYRGALHDQVPERSQRCGRRRGDCREPGTARAIGLVGELLRDHRRGLRQLSDVAGLAHLERAPGSSWSQCGSPGRVAAIAAGGQSRILSGPRHSSRARHRGAPAARLWRHRDAGDRGRPRRPCGRWCHR